MHRSTTQDRKADRHPWRQEEVSNILLDMGLLSLKESMRDSGDPQDMDLIAHLPHIQSLPASSSTRQDTLDSLLGILGSGMFLQGKALQQGFLLGTCFLEHSRFQRVETAWSQQDRDNRHRRDQQVQPGQPRGNTAPLCTFRRCPRPSPWWRPRRFLLDKAEAKGLLEDSSDQLDKDLRRVQQERPVSPLEANPRRSSGCRSSLAGTHREEQLDLELSSTIQDGKACILQELHD